MLLGLALFYVGAVLILNGLWMLGRIGDRTGHDARAPARLQPAGQAILGFDRRGTGLGQCIELHIAGDMHAGWSCPMREHKVGAGLVLNADQIEGP